MRHVLYCLALLALSALWGMALGANQAHAERQDYVGGTGNSLGGYSGTYIDPETGDTVTTVIAPRKPGEQQPWPPIYVYPQVAPQWPPSYGPMPGPNPGGQHRPVKPLPPTPGRPVGPDMPPSGGRPVYPVPGGEWQSPFQYHQGR